MGGHHRAGNHEMCKIEHCMELIPVVEDSDVKDRIARRVVRCLPPLLARASVRPTFSIDCVRGLLRHDRWGRDKLW